MKKWRVGALSMGLSLIFLGSCFLVGQFNRAAGMALAMNCWPFILFALGLEILVSNVILNKTGTKYTYDFLSLIFVGLLSLVSLGVYSLESAGLWERLSEVVGGELTSVEHSASIEPVGSVDKVVLDCGDFWHTVRVIDGAGTDISLRIRGQAYRTDHAEQALAATGTVEQIGRLVYIRLRSLAGQAPWNPRIDSADVIVPSRYKLETGPRHNLVMREFHGTVVELEGETPGDTFDSLIRLRLRPELGSLRSELSRLEAEMRLTRGRIDSGSEPLLERISDDLGAIREKLDSLLEAEDK